MICLVVFFQMAMVVFLRTKSRNTLAVALACLIIIILVFFIRQLFRGPDSRKTKVQGLVVSTSGVIASWEQGDVRTPVKSDSPRCELALFQLTFPVPVQALD